MSGKFKYRHQEEPRMKFYHPDSEAFPIPLKYVGVMSQIQTRISDVSEKIINDSWTDATGVNLSEEWIRDLAYQAS